MTGGAGFTRDGLNRSSVNRGHLKKKAPFQRLKENMFGNKAPKLSIDIDKSTLDDLQKLKKERREHYRMRKLVFVIVFLLALLIFILG